MRYENRTKIPDSALRPLVEWVRSIMDDTARRANILIIYKSNRTGFAGHAYARAMTAGCRSKGFPQMEPFVRILVGPRWVDRQYPITETYKVRAGSMTYQNWQEQMVALLAHELRHIDQYGASIYQGKSRDEMKKMFGGSVEVDAERFAQFALAKFRAEAGDLVTGSITQAAAKEVGTQLKRCPRCTRELDVATHFGFRKVNGKVIPQSYCLRCRRLHAKGW